MEKRDYRKNLTGGVILILLGVFFLAWQIAPPWLENLLGGALTWPFLIIGLGAIFLVSAVISRAEGLAIPGTILSGIGGILLYQNTTGDWSSWAYAWALIPACVGLGVFLSGLLGGQAKARRTGLTMLGIWLAVFAILASIFRVGVGMQYVWPVALIILGVSFLVRGLFKNSAS